MKKLIIICEGYTELAFCKEILVKHFENLNITIEYELTDHSISGGITKWVYLKEQIVRILSSEPSVFVTTLIDYYGIDKSHKFPKWANALAIENKPNRMELLEMGMFEDLENNFQFIPYIQLHEFEAFVFSDYTVFENIYDDEDANLIGLKQICDEYPNPEDINNNIATAPSKRLQNNISRYNKVSSGIDLIREIGLPKIRVKCPRFHNWISKLETI
ncbi:conserved hypothetical protein [Flavobacterium psychrophilum]|uniref:DUF4276 family protein n=1 Tax=Flavobacterium psychrophilum TaxID=96345 RepID=UPI000B7C451E|nr:DUF4276 family protein [Flavobacterium psychrophilum]SNB28243.1 conserved hypothetical protein [Flavobacterium psychrophilum]